MCLSPTASPAVAESPGSARSLVRPLSQALAYGLVAMALAALVLLSLQLLLGRRLWEQRQQQLGSELASRLLLAEVALERFSPAALGEIAGLRLAVGRWPEAAPVPGAGGGGRMGGPDSFPDPLLRRQAAQLQRQLCRRLAPCPVVRPARLGARGVWVRLDPPLEATAPEPLPEDTVWLFAPLPSLPGWPPDPLLLALAAGSGGLGAGLLFLVLEVQRPLRRLEQALAEVTLDPAPPTPLAPRGSASVRRLTVRFNAMVERLERAGRERATMLAGIAHDLRSPLTRLRLRLDPAASGRGLTEADRHRSQADLAALERITRQFLLFAGAEREEAALSVPLQELLAEVAALAGDVPLELDLQPLVRCVCPTALARAVANLLENAITYGAPPLRLVLRGPSADPAGFVIGVWDRGRGIPEEAWLKALEPFQRLDAARGGEGHCGLGLAIAERVARQHGGGLRRLTGEGGFGVELTGRSLASVPADRRQRQPSG